MNNAGSPYILRHVATIPVKPGAVEYSAVFVMETEGKGLDDKAHLASKQILKTFARLADQAEKQGYAMPVSSVTLLEALEVVHTMEAMGHSNAPAKRIPSLNRPGKLLNRRVPEA